MGKSKRSKVKRAFRAVKRHQLRPKAAEQLKKVIGLPIGGTGLPYVDASKSVAPAVIELPKKSSELLVVYFLTLVVGEDEGEAKTTTKLMNEHGNYPVWMNKKEMRRQIGRRKRVLHNRKKMKL